jgi:hypothetical protein
MRNGKIERNDSNKENKEIEGIKYHFVYNSGVVSKYKTIIYSWFISPKSLSVLFCEGI